MHLLMDPRACRDRFFDYCGDATAREAALVRMHDQLPHISGLKALTDTLFGPYVRGNPSLARRQFLRDSQAWVNQFRVAATCELLDVESILADQATPETLEYWVLRMRHNNHPEMLVGPGVNAYASWLRQGLRVNDSRELLFAEHLQRTYRRIQARRPVVDESF